MPDITTLNRHPVDLLQVGSPVGYFVDDNRWGQQLIVEGSQPWQFKQRVERYLTPGPNGEVAWRVDWYWPEFLEDGRHIESVTDEVKGFPCIIYGRRPGSFGSAQWPAFSYAIRAPDGVNVPTAPGGTPANIAAEWTAPGGSVITSAPSGHTPATVLPLQLPLANATLNVSGRFNHNSTPTGRGHLALDCWFQGSAPQTHGFTGANITHEIMIPLTNWGSYGRHGVRNPGWYDHDVVINGVLYHVYCTKNLPRDDRTGQFFSDGTTFPGLRYTWEGLDPNYTNEETGVGRIGWKFIIFQHDGETHPLDGDGRFNIDLGAIFNHCRTRFDSRGIRFAQGTEWVSSVELGVEMVYGAGDITVWDFKVGAAAAPPPPPPPPPAPAPAPSTAPFYPFGSRLDGQNYPFGIQPTNYTRAQMDTEIIRCYNLWKAARLRQAPPFVGHSISDYAGVTITDGYFSQFTNTATTSCVSEGLGYGMLIMVLMAGYDPNARTYFDGMYKIARARPAYGNYFAGHASARFLAEWRLAPNMDSFGDGWSAVDGDEDIAMALLMAHRQWGSGGAINYQAQAINTINAMKAVHFVAAGEPQHSSFQRYASRTSDYMINHFREYAVATGDTFWTATTIPRCATLITNIISGFSPVAKLQPGFIVDTPTAPKPSPGNIMESAWEGDHDNNACRNAWRWGTDYILTGDTTWGNFARDNAKWIMQLNGGNPFQTNEMYHLDGTGFAGTYFAPHVNGPVMVGCMRNGNANDQTWLNAQFQASVNNFNTNYYASEIQLICLLVASGNWWAP